MIWCDEWTVIATRPRFGFAELRWLPTPDAVMSLDMAHAEAARGNIWMMHRHLPDRVECVVRLSKGGAQPALFLSANKRPDLDAAYDRSLRAVMGGRP